MSAAPVDQSLLRRAHERPRLRPGIAAARDDADPHAIVLFDELRISRTVVRLNPREFTWLQWIDGRNSLRDIQAGAMRGDGGQLHPLESLVELIDRLDTALFLDGVKFHEALSGPVREPSCIGCYPGDPDAVRAQLFGYFGMPGGPGAAAPSRRKRTGRLRAVLAPHIDYARGNVAYAWAYRDLPALTDASLFVIVGTSHYSAERFTLTRQDFRTPLGVAPVDQQYVDRIVEQYGDGLFADPLAHVPEHSIELEVVWLQYLFESRRDIRIVPLLVGSFHDCVIANRDPASEPSIRRMVTALQRAEAAANEPVCYVISGDLAHIGPKFGDEAPVREPLLGRSRKADDALIRTLEKADSSAYFQFVAAEDDRRRICGLPPTWTVLQAARPTNGKRLSYGQYVHPRGHESVSFASVALYE